MIIFQYDASRETTYVNSIIQICYASVNRARVKKGRGIFYIYVRIEEGAQIQGSGLSMIMTSIQRPAPPTRYHTYAIINRRGERMMLARGLIYARFRLIFSPRYYITLTIISSSGEKIIEHTMIDQPHYFTVILLYISENYFNLQKTTIYNNYILPITWKLCHVLHLSSTFQIIYLPLSSKSFPLLQAKISKQKPQNMPIIFQAP